MTELRSLLQQAVGTSYTIERELGGGGMSRVFLAEETALGRKVVVKVLPPDLAGGVNVDRFRREIQLSAKLQHPHIVPVLSTSQMDGIPYYTMPYVEGESLRVRLARAGALGITEGVAILRDIAKALDYAHEHGVVHRDIKPDNVLLSGNSAAVADFGIAKAISAARDDAPGGTLTQIGTALGTPAYMSPEQAAADPATNHRADIYAFGCVAFEVLAGRPPFVAKTPQRLLAAQMGEKPQSITELRADVPPALAALVMRCLEKEADARPQHASELVSVLETVTSSGGHAALPPVLLGGAGMLRKALLWYAAAFVVVLILVQAAVVAIGLPDWVLPGAVVVLLLGLPVILFTGYVQRVARRVVTATPTFTPGGTPSMQHGTMATLALKASPHVSWQRAARGGVYAMGVFLFAVAAFMVLRAMGVGPFGTLLTSGALRQREPLLLTDFRVVNGDSTLGPVISQAVRSNLGQSTVLALVPRDQVGRALERMQRLPSSRIDLDLARPLAQREGIRAIVDGEIAGIGSGFLVTLRLVTADSGRELASFKKAADGPTQLIEAVDELSRQLRGKIGESLKEVRASPPLAEVTTGSIEALRKYSDATRATGAGNWTLAASLAREAIALDSGFALAYRHLFESLSNAGLRGPATDSAITRAFQLRERLSERERLSVIGDYYGTGPGRDRVRAIDAFTRQLQLGEYSNTNSLSEQLTSRREFARAESLARVRIRVQPDYGLTYGNLAYYLLHQKRVREADSVVADAERRGLGFRRSPNLRAVIAVERDSLDRAYALLDSLRRTAGDTYGIQALQLMSTIRLAHGRPQAALQLRAMADTLNRARGARPPALPDSLSRILGEAWLHGVRPELVRRLDALIVGSPPSERAATRLDVAGLFAFLGEPGRASQIVSRWEAETLDTAARRRAMPAFHDARARIALAERRYTDALNEFRKADTASDGPADVCAACLPFELGRVFDAAEHTDSAIFYMERTLATATVNTLRNYGLIIPTVEKRLGELYEQRGERQKAYSHYERFVNYWKNAEPELRPRVAEVRQRMARLKDIERR